MVPDHEADVVVIGSDIVAAWIANQFLKARPSLSIGLINPEHGRPMSTVPSFSLPFLAVSADLRGKGEVELMRLNGSNGTDLVFRNPLTVINCGGQRAIRGLDNQARPIVVDWGGLGPAAQGPGVRAGSILHACSADVRRLLLETARSKLSFSLQGRVKAFHGVTHRPTIELECGMSVRGRMAIVSSGAHLLEPGFRALGTQGAISPARTVAFAIDAASSPRDSVIYFAHEEAGLAPTPKTAGWSFILPSNGTAGRPDDLSDVNYTDVAVATAALARYRPDVPSRFLDAQVALDARMRDGSVGAWRHPARPNVVLAVGNSDWGLGVAPAIAARAVTLAMRGLLARDCNADVFAKQSA